MAIAPGGTTIGSVIPLRQQPGPEPGRLGGWLGLKCYLAWGGGGGGWGPYFVSFLQKTYKCTYVLINTHHYLFERLFPEREPPEVLPTGLTQGFV